MAINLFGGLNTPQIDDPGTFMLRAQQAAEPVGRGFLGGMAIGQRREESQAELAERARGTNLLTGLRQQELGLEREKFGEATRQFDALAPFRAAQLLTANAALKSAQAKAVQDGITADNAAKFNTDIVEAQTIARNSAAKGYTPEAYGEFLTWKQAHPASVGTQWDQQEELKFTNSRNEGAKLQTHKQQQELEQRLALERLKTEQELKEPGQVRDDLLKTQEAIMRSDPNKTPTQAMDEALQSVELMKLPRFPDMDRAIDWAKTSGDLDKEVRVHVLVPTPDAEGNMVNVPQWITTTRAKLREQAPAAAAAVTAPGPAAGSWLRFGSSLAPTPWGMVRAFGRPAYKAGQAAVEAVAPFLDLGPKETVKAVVGGIKQNFLGP